MAATQDFILELSKREQTGKVISKKLRNSGNIPGVIYHRGEESIPVYVSRKEFYQLASQAKKTQVFAFKSNETEIDGKLGIVRDVQKNFVNGALLHVDFLLLREDEEILVKVLLELKGESPGVKNEGGVLSFVHHEVSVYCLPKDIPSSITIDISELKLGFSIHGKDLVLPQGVRLADDEAETFVSVVAARTGVEEAVAPEGAAVAGAAPSTAAKGGSGDKKAGDKKAGDKKAAAKK
jgi:large subunit ribosomal protein L25